MFVALTFCSGKLVTVTSVFKRKAKSPHKHSETQKTSNACAPKYLHLRAFGFCLRRLLCLHRFWKRVLFGYKNLNQKNESQVKIHNVQIDNNQTTFAADTLDELVELVRAKLHRFVFHPPRSAKLFSPQCLRRYYTK